MRNKSTLAFLLGIGLSLASAVHGKASEYADTPTEPADAVRIPRTLTLLQDTPYYVIPNALVNKTEGAFSPQTVEVIEAETRWAEMPNWWKIRTTFGDRWIKTEPVNIDVLPPSKITLMENTPIYTKPVPSYSLPPFCLPSKWRWSARRSNGFTVRSMTKTN
ncbi:hypothetical protein [Paenibacillus sp. A3]|uniref:hypothetical protein n=1 Tax=Paenibacillus sp. A3 TaxID=1337054 RepID=UPI001ED9A2A2|nr:hypothetical protein [Paenibacillus sp. A3]